MSIVLSASVRQNLLSLQSTADLLSTTQNRLATGNKVNSALDNPTNYFTAQGLNNRASDINNLLDSIGNGVQVLQAANTGITSLQKLVDTAKSIANQVLQAPAGYSAKSMVTSAAALGGTAANLVDGATIKAGQTIIVAANGALPAVTVTVGATYSLDQLNTALAPANLTASLDSANKLVFTTTNDFASSTIGAVTVGSTPGSATFGAAVAPVADAASQTIRASLVKQYNDIITQISTTSQDSSFNGINLLNGDNLKLTFSVDLPVSLKVSLRSSPFKRLMPLNDASCDVVVIWVMMLLYWLTRLARMVCEAASATGATAAPNVAEPGVEPTVIAPIVDEAKSLAVVKTSLLALSRLAVILPGANAAFNWSSE